MARDFNGSSEYLSNDTGISSAYPLTIFCWNSPDNGGDFATVWLGDKDSNTENFQLGTFDNDSSGETDIRAVTFAGSADVSIGDIEIPFGTWVTIAGIWRSATDREFYTDGVSDVTDSTSVAHPTGIDNTTFGRNSRPVPAAYFNGDAAEFACWNVALSDNEMTALGSGVNPFAIRYNDMIIYVPIYGNDDPEPDLSGNNVDLAVTGTTPKIAHPPVELLENYL